MNNIPLINMSATKKRNISIREADNGYIMIVSVENPNGSTASERYMSQELVITSLPQLLKKIKTFLEPEIVENETI